MPDTPTRGGSKLPLIAAAILLVLLGAGFVVWKWFNPFALQKPVVREAKTLLESARAGSLSDRDFSAVLGLLETDNPIAQNMAIAIVELEAGRSDDRRTAGLTALRKCQTTADPAVAKTAGTVIFRIESKPAAKSAKQIRMPSSDSFVTEFQIS
jgi:hypothetical protein